MGLGEAKHFARNEVTVTCRTRTSTDSILGPDWRARPTRMTSRIDRLDRDGTRGTIAAEGRDVWRYEHGTHTILSPERECMCLWTSSSSHVQLICGLRLQWQAYRSSDTSPSQAGGEAARDFESRETTRCRDARGLTGEVRLAEHDGSPADTHLNTVHRPAFARREPAYGRHLRDSPLARGKAGVRVVAAVDY